ncbi:replication initiation protein [Salmonella enterica subsp. enterica serovar Oranienburg]|uniref:Replication initiation protein n=1 Tax=Salmonella diarizonae TaxID=59204 RepID=A0A5Y1YE67_SALDZ|nr:replication initiation protein [Salmonella enterica subsp. enterica serovar Oranienburg]ECC3916786.1 replication initiation protein [Salmonella enterica subsp. diarizonae]EEH0186473.1 RepB family plasmid replication initiator protein [Salmonella enterica subsp. enterica serovar Oranienburg]
MGLVMKTVTGLTKVRHRNEVGITLASLSLSAKRVLFLALCQIDTKEILDDDILEVDADFFSKATALDKYSAYAALKEGAKVLSATTLVLNRDDLKNLANELGMPFSKNKMPDRLDLNLTEFCAYYEHLATVKIKFTNTAKRYFSKLIGLENRYTTQVLKSVVLLNSVNSTNLYQVIRRFYSQNNLKRDFDISVNELKDEMGLYTIEDNEKIYKYPKYSFFVRDVINKSIKEITEKTEIKKIQFSVVGKKGRMAYMLRFEFTINELTSVSEDDVKFLEEFDKKFPPKKK